jgi:hypothetical protein
MYGSVLGTGEAVGRAMRAKSKRLKRSNILIFSRESLRSLLLLLALQHKEGSVRHWKAVWYASCSSLGSHTQDTSTDSVASSAPLASLFRSLVVAYVGHCLSVYSGMTSSQYPRLYVFCRGEVTKRRSRTKKKKLLNGCWKGCPGWSQDEVHLGKSPFTLTRRNWWRIQSVLQIDQIFREYLMI